MEPDGSFAEGESGELVELGSGILVAWEDVEFLEVFPAAAEGSH